MSEMECIRLGGGDVLATIDKGRGLYTYRELGEHRILLINLGLLKVHDTSTVQRPRLVCFGTFGDRRRRAKRPHRRPVAAVIG